MVIFNRVREFPEGDSLTLKVFLKKNARLLIQIILQEDGDHTVFFEQRDVLRGRRELIEKIRVYEQCWDFLDDIPREDFNELLSNKTRYFGV